MRGVGWKTRMMVLPLLKIRFCRVSIHWLIYHRNICSRPRNISRVCTTEDLDYATLVDGVFTALWSPEHKRKMDQNELKALAEM